MFRARFAQTVLVLHAVAFMLVAITALRDPQALMQAVGIQIQEPGGFNEIRAAYGGSYLLLALLFFAAAISKRLRFTGLVALVCVEGGLVLGRTVSLLVDGAPGSYVWRMFAMECVGAIAAAAALAFHRGTRRPSLHAGDL